MPVLSKLLRRAVSAQILRSFPTPFSARSIQPYSKFTSIRPFSTETKDATIESETVLNDSTSSSTDDFSSIENDFKPQTKKKRPAPTPPSTSNKQNLSFQAETRQILDIVAHSLYTDKEVFLRELISNASDALEKRRYLQTQNKIKSDSPLEINIETDEDNNLLVIRDSGIGMNKEELISNLGTIARSGSKAFMNQLKSTPQGEIGNIIGQFGVGFYSAFMVGDKIEVFSRSAQSDDQKCYYWISDGSGSFEVSEVADSEHQIETGTRIVIHLKKDMGDYALKYKIEDIIQKYSNYVTYPILLNGERVNTVNAIWAQFPSSVKEEDYKAFYKFYANAHDEYLFKYHFETDAPLAIKALFFFPSTHMEKLGMPRMEMGVNLYCRKVLIKAKCKEILPEYLRFVKGVVDSEDIPLNISRENMQDSRLIRRMNDVLTKKILKFLDEQARKDPKFYNEKFVDEFGIFLKEGTCMDYQHKDLCAKLLRYQTSFDKPDELSSLDDYIGRMEPSQKNIYYLLAPNRDSALASPYYEAFKAKNIEVLFCYNQIDEFVMANLQEYNKRNIVNCETANLDELKTEEEKKKEEEEAKKLNSNEVEELMGYIKSVLDDRVSEIRKTVRLSSSPAIIVEHESAAVRRMKKQLEQMSGKYGFDEKYHTKYKMEINIQHPIFKYLISTHKTDPHLAKVCVESVYDNALISADLLENPRSMVTRVQELMEQALKSTSKANSKLPLSTTSSATEQLKTTE